MSIGGKGYTFTGPGTGSGTGGLPYTDRMDSNRPSTLGGCGNGPRGEYL